MGAASELQPDPSLFSPFTVNNSSAPNPAQAGNELEFSVNSKNIFDRMQVIFGQLRDVQQRTLDFFADNLKQLADQAKDLNLYANYVNVQFGNIDKSNPEAGWTWRDAAGNPFDEMMKKLITAMRVQNVSIEGKNIDDWLASKTQNDEQGNGKLPSAYVQELQSALQQAAQAASDSGSRLQTLVTRGVQLYQNFQDTVVSILKAAFTMLQNIIRAIGL